MKNVVTLELFGYLLKIFSENLTIALCNENICHQLPYFKWNCIHFILNMNSTDNLNLIFIRCFYI